MLYLQMNKTQVLRWLERRGTQRNIDGMARYAIVAKHVYGVGMTQLKVLKKRIGKDHALALRCASSPARSCARNWLTDGRRH